jgi:hypothetical protein
LLTIEDVEEMNTMKKQILIALGVFYGMGAWPASGQVDYHRAQQAGKVWERKQGDAIRERRAKERRSGRAVKQRPVSAAERASALRANRAAYDRLVRSVGRKNADRWLDFKVRAARRASSGNAGRKR